MVESTSWRKLLTQMVAAAGTDLYPLCVFEIRPSSHLPWPAALPACQGLLDFYALCDGGNLSLQYTFLPLAELEKETCRWNEELPGLSSDDQPYKLTDQQIVLGEDSGGGLLVWDGKNDEMSSLYWKGGTWEPFGLTFESFMRTLFTNPILVQGDDMWAEALGQLE